MLYCITNLNDSPRGRQTECNQLNGEIIMKRITTINTRDLNKSAKTGGCGECQTSCQSACKTSCGVANQKCENKNK